MRGGELAEAAVDRTDNDRTKPPGNWSDGVREPRPVLSPEPNRDLLGEPAKTPRTPRVVEHRAANQPFVDEIEADV